MAPREYCVWSSTEEQALLAGVQRHGLGAWEVIRSDPAYKTVLKDRTGVQLKDKWRNLVKFKHVGRVSAEAGQAQTLNFRDRKRRRLHSPDQVSHRTSSRRETSTDSPVRDTTEERSHVTDGAPPSPAVRSIEPLPPRNHAPLHQHRARFEEAEQHYASVLAVTLLAQAAFDALTAGSADSAPSDARRQTAQMHDAAPAAAPKQLPAMLGSSSAERADSAPPQAAPQEARSGLVIKLAGGDVPLPGSAQPHERSGELQGPAGVPSTGEASKREGSEGAQDIPAGLDAGLKQGQAGQGEPSGFKLEPDDLQGSCGVATWLADSKQQLRAAEQEVRAATAELEKAEKAAETPPPTRRKPLSTPARRVSERNVGKQRRSYRDELGSDPEEESDADDEDQDDLADGMVPSEDRRYGIYDTRRYQAPLRGRTPSWGPASKQEEREHRGGRRPGPSEGREPSPQPETRSLGRRMSSASSLPPGRPTARSSQPVRPAPSIAPRDSIGMDFPDLLHTLLELNTGRPGGSRGEGEEVLAWQDRGFRSPRYPRGYWPTHLLGPDMHPLPSRPIMPQAFQPSWPRQRMQEQPLDRRLPSIEPEPVSPGSRPRRRSGKPARLRDMVVDDSGEDRDSGAEPVEPDSEAEESFRQSRPRGPEARRGGVKWGRTRPRRMADALTDDDSTGDMTFDKDMREGALALTLAHDNAYHADEPADLGGLSPRAAPGLQTLSRHFHLPKPDPIGPRHHRPEPHPPRGVARQPSESLLRDMFNDDAPHVQPPHSAAHHTSHPQPRHDHLYMPHARVGQPMLPFASHPGDLLLARHDHQPSGGLLGPEHHLMDRPSSRGTNDMGLLGMLGLVHATAQMRGGQVPRPPHPYDVPGPRPGLPNKGALINGGRLPYSAPQLDDVDLDLAAEQHHNMAFDPLRADTLHNRLESPHSGSSNRSSDVAASESHYPAPQGLPHQPTWVHPAWGMGLPAAPARELVNSRQLACGTPPLLLNAGPRGAPGVPMQSQNTAAGFGAELDEAAAAITSMMHHGAPPRQGLPEGYGSSYPNGGSDDGAMGPEQMGEASTRAGDLRAQAATPSELMDGHDPQLHFDLDQMLDVHQDAHGIEARMTPRVQSGAPQVPQLGNHAGRRSP